MASRAEISGVNCRQMGIGKLTELAVIGSCRLASQNIALIFLIGRMVTSRIDFAVVGSYRLTSKRLWGESKVGIREKSIFVVPHVSESLQEEGSMKRIVCTVGIFVLACGVTILAQQKSGSAKQELIDLEHGWAAAQVQDKLDLAFLDRILADDYVQTNWDGTRATKAQVLASLKSKEDAITYSAGDDYEVRVYGDAAVVTGRWTGKETIKGKDTSGQYRWTDTWIKKAGRWQCVASQNAKIS
jgi:hypothetical protein